MPYLLWVNQEAEAEIRQLPGHVRQRIRRAIRELHPQPRPSSSIQMDVLLTIPMEVRRIRIDVWRIVYISAASKRDTL